MFVLFHKRDLHLLFQICISHGFLVSLSSSDGQPRSRFAERAASRPHSFVRLSRRFLVSLLIASVSNYLNVQKTQKSVGGHYHNDIEGEAVAYEGYFVVADKLFRIDQP